MIFHSSYIQSSSFPISVQPSYSATSSPQPPTVTDQSPAAWASSPVVVSDCGRKEELTAAQWWMWGATQDDLLVAFPGCCRHCLLVTMPLRFYCRPQFQPHAPAVEHNSELLPLRSLFSPSCILLKFVSFSCRLFMRYEMYGWIFCHSKQVVCIGSTRRK
jgi:hypothetical protein